MNRRWVCNDVWMDIFPSFDRPQLGLKLALLSPRFNALVDKHFDGKRELTIWRPIEISKGIGPEPKLSVEKDDKFEEFPLPNRPLHSKIRFKHLRIKYIDHSVIAFLRLNHQIFDKRGTIQLMWLHSQPTDDEQPIWDIFVREIWPIFSANICHLGFSRGYPLDNLLRRTSPTILIDLNHLISINSFGLMPEAIAFGDNFGGPNGTISAGQALSKWLHSPRKDGMPKRLRCDDYSKQANTDWVNNFKEHFLRANAISSVSYEIHFTQMVPFELVHELTKEKLTLTKVMKNKWDIDWIMKRCKIGETAAAQQQQQKKDEKWINNLNSVSIRLFIAINCIGPLSPPPAEEMN